MHRAVSGIVDQIVDHQRLPAALDQRIALDIMRPDIAIEDDARRIVVDQRPLAMLALGMARVGEALGGEIVRKADVVRSEEHTSELQSLMRISYAVFCVKKKQTITRQYPSNII